MGNFPVKPTLSILVSALVIPFVIGCSGGGSSTDSASDKAFQEGLAAAAAKDKGGSPKNKTSMGKLPPKVAERLAAGGSAQPKDGLTAPVSK